MVEQTPYQGRPGVNHHESGTGTPYNAKIQEMVYDIINSDIGNKYWEQVLGPDKRECTFSSSFLLRLCGAYRETLARNTWTSTSKINPPPAMYIRSLTCIQDQTDPYPT